MIERETQAQWNQRQLRKRKWERRKRILWHFALLFSVAIAGIALSLMLSSETTEPGFPGW